MGGKVCGDPSYLSIFLQPITPNEMLAHLIIAYFLEQEHRKTGQAEILLDEEAMKQARQDMIDAKSYPVEITFGEPVLGQVSVRLSDAYVDSIQQ